MSNIAPTPTIPPKSRWRRARQVLLALGLVLFLAFNALAFLHAWSITHYAPADVRSTRLREVRTGFDKARLLILGPRIRRMANTKTPAELGLPFEERTIPGANGQRLAAWRIPGQPGRPTVLMFPGYGGSRDTLLRAAAEFHAAGCEAWLVDFAGIGDSAGRTVTLGWREAEDVAATVQATRAERRGPLVLYGTSMGAVAILAAQHRGLVAPDAVILECPFDRLSTTLGNRLALLGVPRAPLAQGIAFWIGVQHGFNGFAHDPITYARSVRCPVLFLQGENDTLVGRDAALAYARVFGDRATFHLLPRTGHAWLLRDAPELWRASVRGFLEERVLTRAPRSVQPRHLSRSARLPLPARPGVTPGSAGSNIRSDRLPAEFLDGQTTDLARGVGLLTDKLTDLAREGVGLTDKLRGSADG